MLNSQTMPILSSPSCRPLTLAALIGAALCAPAQAAISDTIHPFVSVAYSYEDNLLRLPDGVPGPSGSRSDNMTQIQAGLLLERPIGRQLLTAQAKVSRVSFSHYDQLNYNGKDLSAEWQWFVLRDFSGHLGASYAEVLTPFTDYHSSERNLRTTRRIYGDGNWRFHPSWQVHAGVSHSHFSYDLASQRFLDRTEDSDDVGFDYLAASGSRFGMVARHTRGEYPNKQPFGTQLIDNGFSQDDIKANVYWLASGVTQVQVLAGWAKREHNFFTNHDASGANGRVTVYWQPLGRVKFTLAGWREFAAVESTLVSSSLNKGASVGATYDLGAKLRADASVRHESRDFNTINSIVLPGPASDSGTYATTGLTYAPTQHIQLNVSVFRESRSGSAYVGTGSYTAKGATVSATGQF